jgi:hypothetical protein
MRKICLICLVIAGLLGGVACSGESDGSGVRDHGDDASLLDVPQFDLSQHDGGDSASPDGVTPDGADKPDGQGDGSATDGSATDSTAQGGEIGAPCVTNDQCLAGYCIPSAEGSVCTDLCYDASSCPDGWTCKGITLSTTDPVWICVPVYTTLCDPCTKHGDCSNQFTAEGNYCIDKGPQGKFCGGNCTDFTCPGGYTCQEVLIEGVGRQQCVPDDGECVCSGRAIDQSLSTTCAVENEWGLCVGGRMCTLSGLTPCDAPYADKELCNGIDDNCDGVTDNITSPEPCQKTNEWGTCPGVVECNDTGQGTCNASVPAQDECDGKDNDCDGATDEDDPDTDQDGAANCVDPDDDDDGILDDDDDCPTKYDPDQEDHDGDGDGDACDADDDNDGVPDADDCKPFDPTVNEFMQEICDDKDNNCDGQVDEGLCDDGNPCTDDVCHADGACTWVNTTDPCDDQSMCTLNDVCNNGACIGSAQLDCNDGNPCTADLCNPASGCYYAQAPDGTACEDGDKCTDDDQCYNGACFAGGALNCNDNDPCTMEQCSTLTGCVFTPSPGGTPCNDDDVCTVGDQCGGGECVTGAPYDCTNYCPPGSINLATCINLLGSPTCAGLCL